MLWPEITLETIVRFEQLAEQEAYSDALQQLILILFNLDHNVKIPDLGLETIEANLNAFCNRIVNAFHAIILSPGFLISVDGFSLLTVFHRQLNDLYALSDKHTLDTLKIDLEEQYTNGEQKNIKLLLADSLNSQQPEPLAALIDDYPLQVAEVAINMQSESSVIGERAESRWRELQVLNKQLDNIIIKDIMLDRLASVWMRCTYADFPNKHDIKLHLNHMLASWVRNKVNKIPALPKKRRLKDKPVILLPLEKWHYEHATYRCIAPYVRQLKQKFTLIGMTQAADYDSVGASLLNDIVEIDFEHYDIANIIQQVRKLKPDLIYFPIIGMRPWTIILANLRLAPIQFANMGHPATTQALHLDYMLFNQRLYRSEEEFSEKIILLPKDGLRFINIARSPVNAEPRKKHVGSLTIAIPAKAYKLNHRFLTLCQTIQARSQRVINFRFFPNLMGLNYFHFVNKIKKYFPDARVYPTVDYITYLQNLNECDLHLSPFPFGGTNSNIDSFKLGIPVLTLEGNSLHTCCDAEIIRNFHLPESLITHTEADYIENALNFIHNDDLRLSVSQQLLEIETEESDLELTDETSFLDTVWWMYQHHDKIQREEKRVYYPHSQKN